MGTPFSTGQLGKLQSVVSIAVSTALPRVAAKFDDPKAVLKALEGKGEIFAGHLESALAEALGQMLVLVPRPTVTVTLTERHDPDTYFKTRKGLYVYGDFRDRVVAKARPTEGGSRFTLSVADLAHDATDEEIESALPAAHLFDESAVCGVIAGLIALQPTGEVGSLANTGYANLFYTRSCVVDVDWNADYASWRVDAWLRGDGGWDAGVRAFSPAN